MLGNLKGKRGGTLTDQHQHICGKAAMWRPNFLPKRKEPLVFSSLLCCNFSQCTRWSITHLKTTWRHFLLLLIRLRGKETESKRQSLHLGSLSKWLQWWGPGQSEVRKTVTQPWVITWLAVAQLSLSSATSPSHH